jgi:hypothetical protein
VSLVARAVANPTPYNFLGITFKILVGVVREFAAPYNKIKAAKIKASLRAPESLWEVTSPPNLIPTKKFGSSISGIENRTRPGIGTPMMIAKIIRIAIAIDASRRANWKVLYLNNFLGINLTKAIVPTMVVSEKRDPSNLITAVTSRVAHSQK